ncbi:uncharacterized protein LAJ45_11437 [Morchella importuna]|uniref:uncharacterized protein n=1 Tax=Morchella importuna TaxID=1174673 RepID=UPI001E8E5BC3|nr:uncharacterized protein LAJ45_11437 [Morchella importuna]KAH8144540.1 hypothetical protein LAJ45_11437 [Morchella importuna]
MTLFFGVEYVLDVSKPSLIYRLRQNSTCRVGVIREERDFKKKSETRRPGSYIQGLSAPTTPGILSRNQSFTSQRSFHTELPKSKSSSHLTSSHSTSNQWLQRTGAALTSETRESKGQSWLTSRASSTSLVREGDDDDGSIYYGADDEFSPLTPRRRLSRNFSGEFYTNGLEALEEDFSPTRGDHCHEGEEEEWKNRVGAKRGNILIFPEGLELANLWID